EFRRVLFRSHLLAEPVLPSDLCVDGRPDVLGCNHLTPGHLRVVISLTEQVRDRRDLHGESTRIACDPCGMLDGEGDRGSIEWFERSVSGQRSEEPRVQRKRLWRAIDALGEIGDDAEQRPDVLIVSRQEVIEQAWPDEADPYVERYGIRLEGERADQAQHLSERLDPDLMSQPRTLQSL